MSQSVLQPNCAWPLCHSEAAHRSGLRLDDLPDGYASLINGTWIEPGQTDLGRHALSGVLHGTIDQLMPPAGRLSDADLALIDAWLVAGAKQD